MLAMLACAAPATAGGRVDAGALKATVASDPWHLDFRRAGLASRARAATGPSGSLGFATALGWAHATRVASEQSAGGAYEATLDTTEAGRQMRVRLAPGRRWRDRAASHGHRLRPAGDAGGHRLRHPSRRALPGLRRALERRRPARPRGGELRVRRPVHARGPCAGERVRAAVGPPRPRGRHLLPRAVAAVHRRVRRAGGQPRDQPVPPGQRPRRHLERRGRGEPCWSCAWWPGPRPADALDAADAPDGAPAPARGTLDLRPDLPAHRPGGGPGGPGAQAARDRRAHLGDQHLPPLPAVRRPAGQARRGPGAHGGPARPGHGGDHLLQPDGVHALRRRLRPRGRRRGF